MLNLFEVNTGEPKPSEEPKEIKVEEVPLGDEKEKESIHFSYIALAMLLILITGGSVFLIWKLLPNRKAEIRDKNTEMKLGTTAIKKGESGFEAFISDKVFLNQEKAELVILPNKTIVKKYSGYSLTVKSTKGMLETKIAEKIEVSNFS